MDKNTIIAVQQNINLQNMRRTNTKLPHESKDYYEVLNFYGLEYKVNGHFIQVGNILCTQGWILHLSVVQTQMTSLLHKVIPLLVNDGVTFKIPIDIKTTIDILDGIFGETYLGKVLTIYPIDETQAFKLACRLVEITKDYKGPIIPTDAYLGTIVFTRYGAFKPIQLPGEEGEMINHIYNNNGQLIKDEYKIPFELPKGIRWPFTKLSKIKTDTTPNIINQRYKITSLLKHDPKGNVYEGIYHRKLFKVSRCVIKEGRKGMIYDSHGRDIHDRLEWQYKAHKYLEGKVELPKAIDFFVYNTNTYFCMEQIDGVPLNNVIESLYNNTYFQNLSLFGRMVLIDYILTIISIIEKLHQLDIIHRDITTTNFLVSTNNRIYLIDLELSYSNALSLPHPPFKEGTPGYMSPQQKDFEMPSISDDIYAIGGLIIAILTNLLPHKFNIENIEFLESDLEFFIHDEGLIQTICSCLNQDSTKRPTLQQIRQSVEQYRRKQETILQENTFIHLEDINYPKIQLSIQNSVNRLTNLSHFKGNSRTEIDSSEVEENKTKKYADNNDLTLSNGISGLLYILSRAHNEKYNVSNLISTKSLGDLFTDTETGNISLIKGGLLKGLHGVFVAITSYLESGLSHDSQAISLINQYIDSPVKGMDVFSGLAGKGIAILKCQQYIDSVTQSEILKLFVSEIITKQTDNGSWNFQETYGLTSPLQPTGFLKGVSGIAYFLLCYFQFNRAENALAASEKALSWLIKSGNRKPNHIDWTIENSSKNTNFFLAYGTAGIALSFIKAYELTAKVIYKEIAEDSLSSIPFYIIDRNFDQANGLSGLGEVYLKAFEIFKDEQWRKRANWIASVLLNCKCRETQSETYWIPNVENRVTDSFLTGTSGIINFLINISSSRRSVHPLMI